MKAFKGDDELNQDAEKAQSILKQQIGEKISHKICDRCSLALHGMTKYWKTKQKSAQAIELISHFNLTLTSTIATILSITIRTMVD